MMQKCNKVVDKTQYLISAYYHSTAMCIAGAMGLKSGEWVYIPMDEGWRDRALRGRRASIDNLIGHFLPHEIKQLTGAQ